MITLQAVELGVLGPLQVRLGGAPVAIPGAKPRAILTMLGLHCGSVVSADTLMGLLWGEDPPRTAAKALQTHISALRRTLGDGFVLTAGAGWALADTETDAARYKSAARLGRDAAAAGDTAQALARFEEALALWRGIPELPDGQRGTAEKTRWVEGHAALVEDRADALLAAGRAAEIIGELEAAVAEASLRERRWGQLMLALYRAGRQGEALGAYQRARALLADELGVDPGPELRRLESKIVGQDAELEIPAAQQFAAVTRAVTFLLTDIEGSTAAWEADADAMATALARHDELVEQVVTSRGGRLIKTRGEGDATFSVFERPSAAAAAAIELQEAIAGEPWVLAEPMRVRVALHTGEVELRDGDYFGRAVNRAARLRSLALGGQILCSGAVAELVIDALPDDVALTDLGMRQLKNLPRPEHVFELRLETVADRQPVPADAPLERPSLPAVLGGQGPFVGRGPELGRLFSGWQTVLAGGTNALLIAGEPGVGKTRLAGEWSRQAYDQGALVIYGRCDEDLGAPYQPFAEALRALVPCLGPSRLRGIRGVEALLALVPGLTDVLPDLAAPARADPDTERYALFDAVVAVLGVASAAAPVVLILDDLHWAAKPTLLLLRHLLRFGEHARVQIVGTYRSTDLDRAHPLAAMLADLHRDGTAERLSLSGLDEGDVTAYVAEAGYDDEELAHALASVTGGNPFFLIEALRHVDESGGRWDPSTLPQGVREAVSRRLSRLVPETNKALAAAAVIGSRFGLELVESVVGGDLVDAFDEACKAGIIIEESGGRYRFNHALIRQSLLAELPSVRRMRLHQRIAATLESQPGADDELLAELAHHYFECAWAGNAAKAVEYCRRAADQAMARLGYEGAADLYDRALHALEEIDDELPDRDDQAAELLVARCEALLAAGDVTSAAGAVSQLQAVTVGSARLAAWATCFDGQLSMLIHPERLDEVEAALGAAAGTLAELDDAAGEAKAHTVRAGCLARLGRIGDCETALDAALTAARRAREHRRVNAVLAGAPLAALWGPNPVPRAGGRCLDVVRLLRITTDSPAVEATSTRCQAVLDAFRGRTASARQMIDSARRTLTELGLRHALLEVEQFAGIIELVADDPAAAEPHLRRAYTGFRRMRLDADTAETAALLGRACLALDRDAEADELCTESERLAGHDLKASIAWRTLRAQLLSRGGDHDEARRVAEAAVGLAERTDLLVDHGDACLALGMVVGAAGDSAGARSAAERAVGLFERKGAADLVEKARLRLGERGVPAAPAPPEAPVVELDNACVRVMRQMEAANGRNAFHEAQKLYAPDVFVESRRKIVGFGQTDLASGDWPRAARHLREGWAMFRLAVVAVRGERLALTRFELGTDDASPGAPQDEMLALCGLDEDGRMALQVFFDLDDFDAATAELDAVHARFEAERPPAPLENAATRAYQRLHAYFVARDWAAITELLDEDYCGKDRRSVVGAGIRQGRDSAIDDFRSAADLEVTDTKSEPIATRGANLALTRARYSLSNSEPDAFYVDFLQVVETNADERITALIAFDLDDTDAALAELEARNVAPARPLPEAPGVELDNACVRVGDRLAAAIDHADWDQFDRLFAPEVIAESRRKIVGFTQTDLRPGEWPDVQKRILQTGDIHVDHVPVAVRGERSTLFRVVLGTDDVSPGAPHDEFLLVLGLDEQGQIALQVSFDVDDLDAALAELDTVLARFEAKRLRAPLENTASRVLDRYFARFAARDWAVMVESLTDDFVTDDRRRVVNAGVRHSRDAEIVNMRSLAEIGILSITSPAIATRGERLVLVRHELVFRDGAEPPSDVIGVVEISADNQIAAHVMFDADDIDAAFTELDARYLTGEAAAHAQTWSAAARTYAAANEQQLQLTPDCVSVDHRRARAFAPGEFAAYMHATWDIAPNARGYVEAVHRLTDIGAVITHVARGRSREGFDAEWREVLMGTFEGELTSRCEIFDEADLDAALTKFDLLSRPAPRPENAASEVAQGIFASFAARDWAAIAEALADDMCGDDRRHVVNGGVLHGRDAVIASLQAIAEGEVAFSSTVVATRGARLALVRTRSSGRNQWPGEVLSEELGVVEINSDGRLATYVTFDLDDLDAAFAELDARYLAGEAATHARTWSVIAGIQDAVNRRELPAMTPNPGYIDHRSLVSIDGADLAASIRAIFDIHAAYRVYAEAVHRLSESGAVHTQVHHGTSRDGVDAEWRMITVQTVDGDLLSRAEVFDEADLDTAIARFEELSRPAPRPESAATRAIERFLACVAARDWTAMAEMYAEDISTEDRRRVVAADVLHGREINVANWRAIVDIEADNLTSTTIATRGERLALSRMHSPAFQTEVLNLLAVDADDRIVTVVVFDLDDFDAAIAELDARYLAGEAAAHAHTWSVVVGAYAAVRRFELPAMTPDCVTIDHRQTAAFAPGELAAYIRAGKGLHQKIRIYVEAVHRLTDLGAVVTYASNATTREGFDAEWREIPLVTVDGELISRCELFDEADLDTALARFDELHPQTPRLANTASRVFERFTAHWVARNWDVVAEMLADDVFNDDRRRPVNAGLRRGRDATIASMRASADIGLSTATSTVVATRGERLVLTRDCFSIRDQVSETRVAEGFGIVEIDADERVVARLAFDLDDLDAAFAELETRYVAGEAAAHAHTWSVISNGYAAFSRHEFSAPDWVSVDHRRARAFEPGELTAYMHATWDLAPNVAAYVEAVHRLSDLGAVVTHVVRGTSQQGFEAEWREVNLITIDGDVFDRVEVFDEADLDAALTRFEELSRPTPRLENAASRADDRFFASFRAGNWTAIAEILTDDSFIDDRHRRVSNAGLWDGRDVVVANLRAVAEAAPATWAVVATRGQRLALTRICSKNRDPRYGEFASEMLGVVEIDTDELIAAHVMFDVDDLDAAFAELDARYLAGEAAAHAHTWLVISGLYAAVNRRELPPTTPDWVNVDRQQLALIGSGDLIPSLRAAWDVLSDFTIRITTVHRLTDRGAVVTYAAAGTTRDGFAAEWHGIAVTSVDGDLVNRGELFDEADLPAALARFDELG